MVDDKHDTVIVERDRGSNPLGWIIALIVIILLVAAFFYYGGFSLFGGSTNQGGAGGNVDVNVPDTVKVQPTTGQ